MMLGGKGLAAVLVLWVQTFSCRPQNAQIHQEYESVRQGREQTGTFCVRALRAAAQTRSGDFGVTRALLQSNGLLRTLPKRGCGNTGSGSPCMLASLSSGNGAFEGSTGIRLPLLDLTSSFILEGVDVASQGSDRRSDHERTLMPLPSSHLPEALRSLSLYQMHLTSPLHKMVIKDAIEGQIPRRQSRDSSLGTTEAAWMSETGSPERLYGRLLARPHGSGGLVGAVGCAAEVVVCAPRQSSDDSQAPSPDGIQDDSAQLAVLSRGAFRFVVREVLQTFPYTVAVVEELHDDDISEQESTSLLGVEQDQSDDDYDVYTELKPDELLQRTMSAVATIVDRQRNANFRDFSPLEQAILEQHLRSRSSNGPVRLPSAEDARAAAEEVAAVWQVFASTLDDMAPLPVQRNYAVAMLAAELAEISNEVRLSILETTNSVQRLRVVLREAERRIGLLQAQDLTNEIVETSDQSSKDLQVGEPSMPPWASSIRRGTKVEYYWNEEYGWCGGVVLDDPLLIVNEYVLTIGFDDGTTYKLPLNPDEKVRWRPA